MPRPAKKKAYWEAKKRRMGELQAELEMHKKKPLEESLKEHIGKGIDTGTIIETGLYAGLAGYSWNFFGKTPQAALIGPVALKLATAPNNFAAVSGLALLALMGLVQFLPSVTDVMVDISKWTGKSEEEIRDFIKTRFYLNPWIG